MIDELKKLRELTETLTGNGYLRDQAEEWEYALDAIPDPVFIVNTKFKIKFVNKVLADRLSMEKESCIDMPCYEFIRGEHACSVPEGQTDKPVKIKDEYIENLNGWFNITRSPIYTATNKFIGFICVLQDVTEKKNALERLKFREAMLDTIFNAAPICIGLLERETRVIKAVNKTLVDLTGYSEKELIGKNAKFLYSSEEEYVRVGREKYSNIDRMGYGEVETSWKTKTGESINIYLKSAKMGTNGDIVFTAVDTSSIKETEQTMRLFVEQTPLAVIGWDIDFKVTTWNDAATEIFGFTEAEILGKHADSIVPLAERGHVSKVWDALVNRLGGERSTNANLTKDGRMLYCEWYNNALIDASGNTVGVMSLVMDVTESKLNKDRLNSLLTLATMNDASEDEVIEYALEEAVRFTDSKIGYIHFVNNNDEDLADEELSLSLFKWSKGTLANCTAEKIPHYPLVEAGCWAECVRTGTAAVHNDYDAMTKAQGKKGLPEGHSPITRHLSVPVKVSGKVVAIAGVGNKETLYNNTDTKQLSLFMNSMWDIIQRIRAEEKAYESNMRYKLIIDNVLDAIWTTDTELNFTYVNPAIKKLMGYTPEEWVGNNVSDLAEPKDYEYMLSKALEAAADPDFEKIEFESYMLHKDGHKVHLFISAKPLRDKENNITGFQGITRVLN